MRSKSTKIELIIQLHEIKVCARCC